MQEAVKNKMQTSKKADGRIYVGAGADKRLITSLERESMRAGQLEGIPAATIKTFLNDGVSFALDDET